MSQAAPADLAWDREEIVCSYRQAKNKKQSIRILAELNATTPEKIKELLREEGVLQEEKRNPARSRPADKPMGAEPKRLRQEALRT